MAGVDLLVAAAAPGQPWRPLLIFAAVAVLVGLVAVAHLTDPRRRHGGRRRQDDPGAVQDDPGAVQPPDAAPSETAQPPTPDDQNEKDDQDDPGGSR